MERSKDTKKETGRYRKRKVEGCAHTHLMSSVARIGGDRKGEV